MKLLGWLFVVCGTFAYSVGSFVECDLDLEDPAIIRQLPEQCQNVDDATKAIMLEEAASFKLFHQKLLEYEASQAPNNDDGIHMDMDFRNELYAAGNLHVCLEVNETLSQYLRCLIDKRSIMLDMIEQAI
uniref:Secreted protein n=1 Tax=Anopheles culicifacies TaxID=139723 RepID=A0A182LXX1_9DIPT